MSFLCKPPINGCPFLQDMSRDIKDFCKICEVCQKGNPSFLKKTSSLHPIEVTPQVWHCVGIDLIGPMTDYFSKWAEAIPLQDKTAHGVAEAIYATFCRLGCAAVHISDQGKEFCSQLVEHLYKITGQFTKTIARLKRRQGSGWQYFFVTC